MQLKLFAISFATLSLLGCKDGPKVSVCISKPEISGFVCVPSEGDNMFFVDYKNSDKYVAFNREDAKILIEHCGIKDKPKADDIIRYYARKTRNY